MTELQKQITQVAEQVEQCLMQHLQHTGTDARRLWEAMRYSAGSGGKRIRPYLTCKVAETLGGDAQVALAFGTALEMVHTYSLIHDDLPCMDNDDYRRGKLTCHKMFDEATALLAGDGLLTMAFEVITMSRATDRQKVAATALLAHAAGCHGMIGGQAMDLSAENMTIPLEQLNRLYSGKTGALMRAAVGLGCISANIYDGDIYSAFEGYAEKIGLVFQIVDDILDVTGNEALGKPIGSDEKNGKSTYLSFMTVEEAEAEAKRLTREAKAEISAVSDDRDLGRFADMLLNRKK